MNKFTILEQEIMQDVSISNELCLQQIFKNLPRLSLIARCFSAKREELKVSLNLLRRGVWGR